MDAIDVTSIADKIKEKVALLEEGRKQLRDKAHYKAETISNYERRLAIVLIRLKNGEPLSLEGNVIEKPPATTTEKIAKGICWEDKLALETAEAEYKLTLAKMQAIQAELNGYQSIYRHLESV